MDLRDLRGKRVAVDLSVWIGESVVGWVGVYTVICETPLLLCHVNRYNLATNRYPHVRSVLQKVLHLMHCGISIVGDLDGVGVDDSSSNCLSHERRIRDADSTTHQTPPRTKTKQEESNVREPAGRLTVSRSVLLPPMQPNKSAEELVQNAVPRHSSPLHPLGSPHYLSPGQVRLVGRVVPTTRMGRREDGGVAGGEGEAVCAYLNSEGWVDICISGDSDGE